MTVQEVLQKPAMVPRATVPVGPFKGLDYFVEAEEAAFFGRQREITEIVARVTTGRTLVLYGRSGMGKTSLVRAGLIPELRRRGYAPVYVRPLGDPLADLRAEVARVMPDEAGEGSLHELVSRAAEKRPLVIVLDQFEELFIRFDVAARSSFVEAVAAVLRDGQVDVHWLFSIREEFIAELDAFELGVGDLLDARYRLRGLSRFGAREAIAQPLIHADVEFSQRLLSRLLTIAERDFFDPPLIQIVCTELFREALRSHPERVELDESDLDKLGDPQAIFGRYLRRAEERLPDLGLDMRIVLDGLVTSRRTKRPTTVEGLLEGDFVIRREAVDMALFVLEDERVVRREQRGAVYWHELIHDRMADEVVRFCQRDRELRALFLTRDLLRNTSQGTEGEDDVRVFLGADQLYLARDCEPRLKLTVEERNLLLQSAVRLDHRDVEYWAKLADVDRSTEQLRQQMRDRYHPSARHGAVRAAGAIPGASLRFALDCLRLAAEDAEGTIRHLAMGQFVKIARGEHGDAFVDYLRLPAARVNLLEALRALGRDTSAVDHLPAEVRRLLRRTQTLEELKSQPAIRPAEPTLRSGWGLAWFFAWLLLVALPSFLVTSFWLSPDLWLSPGDSTGAAFRWGFIGVVFLGAAVPFVVNLSNRVIADLYRFELRDAAAGSSWVGALWSRSALAFVTVVLVVLGAFFAFLGVLLGDDRALPVIVMSWLLAVWGAWAALVASTALAVSLSDTALGAAQSRADVIKVSLIASLGAPPLMGHFLFWLTSKLGAGAAGIISYAIVILASLSTAVVVLVLGMDRLRDGAPKEIAPGGSPSRARFLLALLVVVQVGWAFSTTGRQIVPALAPTVDLASLRDAPNQTPILLPWGRAMAPVQFRSLHYQGNDALVFLFQPEDGCTLSPHPATSSRRALDGPFVALLSGDHRVVRQCRWDMSSLDSVAVRRVQEIQGPSLEKDAEPFDLRWSAGTWLVKLPLRPGTEVWQRDFRFIWKSSDTSRQDAYYFPIWVSARTGARRHVRLVTLPEFGVLDQIKERQRLRQGEPPAPPRRATVSDEGLLIPTMSARYQVIASEGEGLARVEVLPTGDIPRDAEDIVAGVILFIPDNTTQ